LKDEKSLKESGVTDNATIRLVIDTDAQEMGLAAGGKITQKIYGDDAENMNQYNLRKVTRVFVNIANGNMWKAITKRTLPKSPITPQVYKQYGYPFYALYDETLSDVDKAGNFSNIQSIKAIEYDPTKPWNCPICSFENVAKNMKCGMCFQGEKPSLKKEQKQETIVIKPQKVQTISHPDKVEDGDW